MAEGILAPLDLVYVCGNKFLAINSTPSSVHLTYRVIGSKESGGITLQQAPNEDPGHSETELETSSRGVVELYQGEERVARRRNEGRACGASAVSASVAGVASADAGSWTAPFPWPIVAVHLSLLSNGKVLSWGRLGTPQVWDPSTGEFTSVPSPAHLFCAGHAMLADGRLLVSGGHISDDHGIPDNTIFTPGGQSWSQSTPMRRGRWYPTATTMGNGDVAILAGGDEAGLTVEEPEVWSPAGVRVLSTASRPLPYYPRAFLAPDGRLFYAGAQQATRYLDISGTGSWTYVAERLYGFRDYGGAVMYDEGKIILAGGGRTTNTAEIIDLKSAAPTWQWTGSMAFPRRNHNATVLPTGEVLVTGGSSGTTNTDLTLAVHAAELWSPATGNWTVLAGNAIRRGYHSTSILLPDARVLHTGSGEGAGMPSERNAELFSPPYLFKGSRPTITAAPSLVGYGTSFSVTTPEAADIAKVSLVRLGSVTHAFDMNQRFQWLSFTHQAGALTIAAPTSRNITPPGHYMLFILDGQGVPSVAKIVKVGTSSEPPSPSSIELTVSGRTDATKQYITLLWTGATGATVDVYRDGAFIKNEPNDGRYVNSRNLPNANSYVYKVCQVGTTICSNEATVYFSGGAPPNAAPSVNFTSSCDGLSCTFTDKSTDADGTVEAWSWTLGDGGTSTSNHPTHTYSAEGAFEVTLVATDDDGATGMSTKTIVVPEVNAAPTASFTQSCTGLTCDFTDTSTDDDGAVTGWSWEFGDGQTSTSPSPSHTFSAEGSYQVTLTATDDENATGTLTKAVSVTLPPPNTLPTASFTSTCTGLTCNFTDTSTDDDGSVTAWSWTFGDGGTSTARNPGHNYAAAGNYTVSLTARDNAGGEDLQELVVTVSQPPTSIVLSVSGRTDATKQYITLLWTGAAGGTVDVYRDEAFIKNEPNDGRYVNSRNLPGLSSYTYRVCQTGSGICSNSATVTFGVTTPTNAPPVANFTSSCSGLTCSFTDRSTDSDGTLSAWSWTFGDGSSSTLRNPGHTYATATSYSVTLEVTDDDGATHQQTASVSAGGSTNSIALSVSGRIDATKKYMTLNWTGATSATVDVYRDGILVKNEPNDGRYVNALNLPGASSYTYKVCEVGGTICSNSATVTFT